MYAFLRLIYCLFVVRILSKIHFTEFFRIHPYNIRQFSIHEILARLRKPLKHKHTEIGCVRVNEKEREREGACVYLCVRITQTISSSKDKCQHIVERLVCDNRSRFGLQTMEKDRELARKNESGRECEPKRSNSILKAADIFEEMLCVFFFCVCGSVTAHTRMIQICLLLFLYFTSCTHTIQRKMNRNAHRTHKKKNPIF